MYVFNSEFVLRNFRIKSKFTYRESDRPWSRPGFIVGETVLVLYRRFEYDQLLQYYIDYVHANTFFFSLLKTTRIYFEYPNWYKYTKLHSHRTALRGLPGNKRHSEYLTKCRKIKTFSIVTGVTKLAVRISRKIASAVCSRDRRL